MSDNEPARDGAYLKFMAAEKARTAAEQERRKACLSERIASEELAEIEQQQAAELPDETPPFDPWMTLLEGAENRPGAKRVYDSNGDFEYRIRSRYLVSTVLGLDAERLNATAASHRLGRCMRALGWRGPVDFRDGKEKIKGYIKPSKPGQYVLSKPPQRPAPPRAFSGTLKSSAEQSPTQS